MQTIKEKITIYWKDRAKDFGDLRERELRSKKAGLWLQEIDRFVPQDKPLRILDVGTGGGFFSLLLAGRGHRVTGIDLTPEMVEKAVYLAGLMDDNAPDFKVMDAEQLDFADETFDLVISRNLTWTLEHVEQAYAEWKRVLKPGGLLLNFDAEYGKKEADSRELPENHAHNKIDRELLQRHEEIKRALDISYLTRPAWDVQALIEAGFTRINIDMDVSERVYRQIDEFYNPVPMFALCGKKK